LNVAILSDYLRLPYANGATLATQFLCRELERLGHDVTVIGPRDPGASESDLPERYVALPSVPLRFNPGVYLPLPGADLRTQAARWDFDVVLGQTASMLIELGVWLRRTRGVPLLAVNTIHLPTVYDALLPDRLSQSGTVQALFGRGVVPALERYSARLYNGSDGLVVLSRGLERHWRARGVTCPIHVIPRSVNPHVEHAVAGPDPFPATAKRGQRLLVVCRHTREKNVERLIRIFATRIATVLSDATLTLVGDGPDHDAFRAVARDTGVAHRVHFMGEVPVGTLAGWYRHADLFVYTSLSETYGQVVSEAMWCGLPVVAFEDGMGVSEQVTHGRTGILVTPGPHAPTTDAWFASEVVHLLRHPLRRRTLARAAEQDARRRCAPEGNVGRFLVAFEAARVHLREHGVGLPEANEGRGADRELRRWHAFATLLDTLGRVRRPSVLNRNGVHQPTWRDLPRAAVRRGAPRAEVVQAGAT
jgi:glycosyltransferase involved in cell wall biosynthesis